MSEDKRLSSVVAGLWLLTGLFSCHIVTFCVYFFDTWLFFDDQTRFSLNKREKFVTGLYCWIVTETKDVACCLWFSSGFLISAIP